MRIIIDYNEFNKNGGVRNVDKHWYTVGLLILNYHGNSIIFNKPHKTHVVVLYVEWPELHNYQLVVLVALVMSLVWSTCYFKYNKSP